MITIPISVDITGGTAPYTFTYTSNNTNVTFSNVTGTAPLSAGIYSATTDVLYATQSLIDTTTITVTFVDANGCSKTIPVTISNPCTLQSSISNNGEFVFVANTTGGSGGYTYNWNYDTAIWSLQNNDTNSTDNYLSLKLNDYPTLPTSTLISVSIMDTNGCALVKTYTYSFCKPRISSSSVALNCDTSPVTGCTDVISQYRNFDLSRNVQLCAGQVIAWPTLEFSIPTGVCVKHLGNGIITITSSLTTSQTKNISFSVRTTSGIRSAFGTVVVTIPTCVVGKNPFGATPQTIQLNADDIVGDTRLLNVEARVGGTPDWSTFTITNTPSWGTVTFNGNRDIVYEIDDITTTPTIPDIITWTLNDYSGGQVNITDTVLRDIIAVPTTVTEVICNSCGETSDPQDLLSNDTGDIDRSTVEIVLNDPDIVITKDTDNNFTFTSLPGASFNNLCSYKVANTQGAYAADQNFFVRTACVGDTDAPSLDLTCVVSKVFDIKDQFTNANSFGDVFVETTAAVPTYASQGGAIVGAEGTVTLTGLVNKTYTFQYTAQNQGGCSPDHDDIGILTVVHGETPNINLSAATLVSTGVYSFTFTYSGIASSFTVTDDGSPAVYHTSIVANNGSGTMTLYAAAASSIVISGVTVCGATTTDTTVI